MVNYDPRSLLEVRCGAVQENGESTVQELMPCQKSNCVAFLVRALIDFQYGLEK